MTGKKIRWKKIVNSAVTVYLFVILAVLPLYHREGFTLIGDRKYRLFFAVSAIALPVLLLAILLTTLIEGRKNKLSLTDYCAAAYGLTVCISFLCSPYQEVALFGYTDWYMGLWSQLFFVGIYFVAAKGFRWNELLLWLACAAAGGIFLLGLLNRYAFDPLGMYGGLEYWNKTHLLATIGNINWYCGYFCVLFPIGFYYDWNGGFLHRWQRVLSRAFTIIAFGTLLTQGSESGLAAFAVVMGFYFYLSFESNQKMKRFLESAVFLGITALGARALYYICIDRAYFGVDLPIIGIITSPLWLWYTGFAGFLYFAFCLWVQKKDGRIEACRTLKISCIAAGILAICVAFLWTGLHFNENWGSGRGLLWPVCVQAFWEMPFFNKLFGVGPDCFAPYLYANYGAALQGFLEGWWGSAVVANAHNEWLNVLINTGIVGLLSYLGIFVTSAMACLKERKKLPLLIAFSMSVLMYAVNNTASFQQVVSTPVLFALLGMASSLQRSEK